MRFELPISVIKTRYAPGAWDVAAFILVFAGFAYLADAAHGLTGSLAHLESQKISLDPLYLPGYAARTALRMLVAMVASLVFTFTYGTLAAKSRRAAIILIPLLDILQSVPILSFAIFIVFFLQLTPGRVAGAELAAIFLVFTSQAWNMAFSFIHSLRSIPDELDEAARSFHLGPWMRFWRLEVPFAMPPLIWNMMMSMSGGWFFVVAAEAISVGHTTVTLPGVGAYIAQAIQDKSLSAIGWAIAAMAVVILIYDQLLFRPLTASADWFRLEQEAGLTPSQLLGAHHDAALAPALLWRAALRLGDSARFQPRLQSRRPAAATAARKRVHSAHVPGRCGVVRGHCRARRGRSVAHRAFHPRPRSVDGNRARRRPGRPHAASCRHSDRARQRVLGADRGVHRHAPAGGAQRRSPLRSSWPRSRSTCSSPSSFPASCCTSSTRTSG